MAGQLIPPPDLAPPSLKRLTSEQRIELWMDLMNTCEQLLLAGLRHRVGPDGDILAAYRRWYAGQMEEHDRTVCRFLERLTRAEAGHGQ
jgi:hypothetical protein